MNLYNLEKLVKASLSGSESDNPCLIFFQNLKSLDQRISYLAHKKYDADFDEDTKKSLLNALFCSDELRSWLLNANYSDAWHYCSKYLFYIDSLMTCHDYGSKLKLVVGYHEFLEEDPNKAVLEWSDTHEDTGLVFTDSTVSESYTKAWKKFSEAYGEPESCFSIRLSIGYIFKTDEVVVFVSSRLNRMLELSLDEFNAALND